MNEDIPYERLVEKALLSVVREALKIAETDGLPGNNHFYITFKTQHAGVILSERLQQAYPEEMTVVIQHEFSGLEVTETAFSVTLSFGNIPERISIPFQAITSFADPHVQFAVSFQVNLEKAAKAVEKEEKKHPVKAVEKKTSDNNDGNVVSLNAFRKKK